MCLAMVASSCWERGLLVRHVGHGKWRERSTPLPAVRDCRAIRGRWHAVVVNSSLSDIAVLAVFAFGGTLWALPKIELAMMPPEERAAIENSVTYSGCHEVRALGKDPIYAGEPGYRTTMDGDGDGVACEPYR